MNETKLNPPLPSRIEIKTDLYAEFPHISSTAPCYTAFTAMGDGSSK